MRPLKIVFLIFRQKFPQFCLFSNQNPYFDSAKTGVLLYRTIAIGKPSQATIRSLNMHYQFIITTILFKERKKRKRNCLQNALFSSGHSFEYKARPTSVIRRGPVGSMWYGRSYATVFMKQVIHAQLSVN